MAGRKTNAILDEARRAFDARRLAEAQAHAERVLRADRTAVDALEILGRIGLERGLYEEAVARFRRCVALRPREPRYTYLLGRALADMGLADEAMPYLDRVLAAQPGDAQASLTKAVLLDRVGRAAESRAILETLCAGDPTPATVAMLARLEIREGNAAAAIDRLRAQLETGAPGPVARENVLFVLAKAYDAVDDVDQAFETYRQANAVTGMRFDVPAYEERVRRQIEVFSAEGFATLGRGSDRTELPVFIAGRPRSGTTLVEQVLDAHPRARGIGETVFFTRLADELQSQVRSGVPYPECMTELLPAGVDQLAQLGLAHLRSAAGSDVDRVVSKALDNLDHLGLIAMLYPGARVIVTRRDPLDTCLSCFMAPITSPRFAWKRSLDDLGRVYVIQETLLAHWAGALDLAMTDVRYEGFIEDQEGETRRIVDFAGLPWDDRCLAFHESGRTVMTLSYDQVSRPVYRGAIGRWKRYEKHLGPLVEALAGVAT